METFSIIIKGDREQAEEACRERSLPFVFKSETFQGKQSILLVDSDYDTLARWLASDVPAYAPGVGYPIGSLLWYRPWPDSWDGE
jgi:hypothetical protein